jgi:hypothetical protein
LLESTKMDFMRLRNESKLMMLAVEISTESIYQSEYLCRSRCVGVPDVPSAYLGMQSSTAVLRKGDDVACMPRHPDDVVCMPHHLLARFDSRLAFDTCPASGLMPGVPKVRISTVQRFGLHQVVRGGGLFFSLHFFVSSSSIFCQNNCRESSQIMVK